MLVGQNLKFFLAFFKVVFANEQVRFTFGELSKTNQLLKCDEPFISHSRIDRVETKTALKTI